MNGIEMCIVGTLGRDPELRFTSGGRAVASCGVAVSRRYKPADSEEWQETTSWVNATMWGELGEHAAASLKKGARIIAWGRFEQRTYTDKEGVEKTTWDMTVDEIGPSLRWATVQVEKIERTKADAGRSGGAPPYQDTEEPF